MLLQDKRLLGRRSIIETIIEQLKNISQIEHSRHRSVDNFFVNLIAGLTAYCHRPHKPSIQLDPKQYRMLISSFTLVLVRRVIGYRAAAAVSNACPVKNAFTTDSGDGRLLIASVQKLKPFSNV